MPRISAGTSDRIDHYSSDQINPIQIHQENRQGSVTPATRQVFSLELKSYRDEHGEPVVREGLVCSESRPRRLAILTANVDRRLEPRAGEDALPMTPRLSAQFEAISNRRRGLTQADLNSYEGFDDDHRGLLTDPRITFLSAADTSLQTNVSHVRYGDIQTLVVPPGVDLKLGTTGVADCLACGLRAPSARQPGHTILILAHFTGTDPDTGEYLSPRQLLDKMTAKAIECGAWRYAEIMVAGGLRARGNSSANRLGDEEDFLDLKSQYPIVAARVQASSVDLNSDKDTIARITDDDHSSSVNVVFSTRDFMCSRAPLYED
ncbi:hypothetical protein C0Z18_26910 [Trinickia dabaoshanensis]|uniref:Uncharacterized protein n=1 Tax=Trinickia dabaoshanensis TaxID=564714 RepID=A0A2N7VE86_9BURK|nr:hypothetical protein [Trinickia dabaoshanensis]PMS15471.1 hypothetical protein C0Z18_26910 [Trinickia dabaoshanensis]